MTLIERIRMWGVANLVVMSFVVAAACVPVTINVNFPQQKIEGAATKIEDMVRTPEGAPSAPQPPEPKKGSGVAPASVAGLSHWFVGEAFGQGRDVDVVPDLKVQTPEILRAIDSRRNRFPQIQQWMTRGCLGENNQGLLEARPGQGCDDGAVGRLASDENRDRMYIYETLRQQNNMPPGDIERIKRGFAKVNRDKAAAGTWIQGPDGGWARK